MDLDSNNAYQTTLDDLSKENIRQLHNVVLNFSSQSTEIKKLFITVEIAVLSLIVTLFKDNYSNLYFIYSICITSIITTILFFIIDSTTYFYQDKLRYKMLKEENKIRARNNLELNDYPRSNNDLDRLKRSIFNTSHIIYYLLMIIPFFILLSMPHINILLNNSGN